MADDISYTLIVKADNEDDAASYIDDWLGIATEKSTSLGYGEVMAVVQLRPEDERYLDNWKRDTKPGLGNAYEPGALLDWTK